MERISRRPDDVDPSLATSTGPAPGKSNRSDQLPVQRQAQGTGLPFMDAIVASQGAPSAHDAPPMAHAGGRPNEFASFADLGIDPRNGLQPGQEAAMTDFVNAVDRALTTWDSQRGTPDLIFRGHADVAVAYFVFRARMITDPHYDLVLREAARRLETGKAAAYVREIRMFNPGMLGDLKRLLNVEDVEPCHTYEFMPVWGGGASGGVFGAKAGLTSKQIRIRYTNGAIPGLSWTQDVGMTGVALGFGLGAGMDKPKGGVSGSGPGGWQTAKDQPQAQYVAPSFFEGASFTSPSASASISMGPGAVKKDLGSALLIEHSGRRLIWDMPGNLNVMDISVEGGWDNGTLDDIHEGMKPSAGVEVGNEFGKTSLDGETRFTDGTWDDISNAGTPANDTWVPLHYARIFFETGSANLEVDRDFKTIQRVVDAIQAWDKKPGYRGSIFKVDISGCHSQKWGAYDDDLRALDGRRDGDGELGPRDARREGDLLGAKEVENYELALGRARNTHLVLSTKLDQKAHQMIYGVMGKSTVAQPTTHEPLDVDPYGNSEEDRSVTVLVSYQIFSDHGQVNLNAPVY